MLYNIIILCNIIILYYINYMNYITLHYIVIAMISMHWVCVRAEIPTHVSLAPESVSTNRSHMGFCRIRGCKEGVSPRPLLLCEAEQDTVSSGVRRTHWNQLCH